MLGSRRGGSSSAQRRALVADSLDGLSVGDALGERFFGWSHDADDLREGWLPEGPWRWTDDTCMASTLAVHVVGFDGVDQDRLVQAFVRDFDIHRGYGHGVVDLLHEVRFGAPWRTAARSSFGGTGSYGNGSAMRVAPLGAFFAGDLAAAADAAALSAEVTHAHPEAVDGAVAVACATAFAAGERLDGRTPSYDDVLDAALERCRPGAVADGIARARRKAGTEARWVATELGSGYDVACRDTVPFCLWAAASHLADYPAAIAACVEGRGDVDTTSAIVGGVVAAFTGLDGATDARPGIIGVPRAWLAAREPLPREAARLRP